MLGAHVREQHGQQNLSLGVEADALDPVRRGAVIRAATRRSVPWCRYRAARCCCRRR